MLFHATVFGERSYRSCVQRRTNFYRDKALSHHYNIAPGEIDYLYDIFDWRSHSFNFVPVGRAWRVAKNLWFWLSVGIVYSFEADVQFFRRKMASIFERAYKFVLVWTLSIFFSTFAACGLLFAYIRYAHKMPWKTKDRILMEAPACLTDPKFGKHKYATVNVRKWNHSYKS